MYWFSPGPVFGAVYPRIEQALQVIHARVSENIPHAGDIPAIVADYLRDRVTTDDYIFVVDYEPIIYHLVPAQIPTRYMFPIFLFNEHFARVVGTDPAEELGRIMEKKPKYIIRGIRERSSLQQYIESGTLSGQFYAALRGYMEQYYFHEFAIAGVGIFRINENVEKSLTIKRGP